MSTVETEDHWSTAVHEIRTQEQIQQGQDQNMSAWESPRAETCENVATLGEPFGVGSIAAVSQVSQLSQVSLCCACFSKVLYLKLMFFKCTPELFRDRRSASWTTSWTQSVTGPTEMNRDEQMDRGWTEDRMLVRPRRWSLWRRKTNTPESPRNA